VILTVGPNIPVESSTSINDSSDTTEGIGKTNKALMQINNNIDIFLFMN
jgi:hypothetical protein